MYPLWTSTLYQMLAGNLALLLTATGMVELFRPHWNRATYIELVRRIRTWWVIFALFSGALIIGRASFLFFMAVVSFLALREYLSLIPTRRARPSLVSRARYTSPIPPAPMASQISDWPGLLPGVRDMANYPFFDW